MQGVISWLLGIFAMVIILVVIEVFTVPKTAKIVKSVCGIAMMIVIVSPVLNSLKNGIDFNSSALGEYGIELDENYLNFISEEKISLLEKEVEKKLDEEYGRGISVDIIGGGTDDFNIEKVLLNFTGFVINEENANINRNEVREFVAKSLNLELSLISIYE